MHCGYIEGRRNSKRYLELAFLAKGVIVDISAPGTGTMSGLPNGISAAVREGTLRVSNSVGDPKLRARRSGAGPFDAVTL